MTSILIQSLVLLWIRIVILGSILTCLMATKSRDTFSSLYGYSVLVSRKWRPLNVSHIKFITSITLESATKFGTILMDEYRPGSKRTRVLQIVPWHTGAIVYDFRRNFRNFLNRCFWSIHMPFDSFLADTSMAYCDIAICMCALTIFSTKRHL